METKVVGKTWVLIAIAVIVVAAIIVYAFFFGPAKPPLSSGTISYAPAGQLIAGFPTDLILGDVSATQESYGIAYSTSTQQSTATFLASGSAKDSVGTLFNAYELYFYHNGWQITGHATAVSTALGMTATKGNATANVTIVQQSATSSKVTVSYVAPQ